MYSSLVNQYIGATHSYVFVSGQSILGCNSFLCIRLRSINTVVRLIPKMFLDLLIMLSAKWINLYSSFSPNRVGLRVVWQAVYWPATAAEVNKLRSISQLKLHRWGCQSGQHVRRRKQPGAYAVISSSKLEIYQS